MKVLLVGGGGREHALAWKLAQDRSDIEILAAPGNPGIAELGRCIPVAATDLDGLAALAQSERVAFTLVGPEAPLADGIVDRFQNAGLPIFGPTRSAARIESSKRFAKTLMLRAGVATARAEHATTVEHAKRAAREFGAPVVIKASGLAAGKGVFVCETLAAADAAIEAMLRDHLFGASGAQLLVEDFMQGEELSIFALTDGNVAVPMLPAQDHKRLLTGDTGPNTGGMGAYAPVSLGTPELMREVSSRIFAPILEALRDEGCPFTGLLYAGLMLTADGAKVVEFNCRFGDPETEALLPLMRGSLLDLLQAVALGDSLTGVGALDWHQGHSVTTVVSAAGYPDAPRQGDAIRLPAAQAGVHVFHAGTQRDATGQLVASGGRVLAVTAVAPTLSAAARASAGYAERVQLAGAHFRTDIGWRELRRAGAS